MASIPPPSWSPPAAPQHPAPPQRPELPDGIEPSELHPRWRPYTAWVALLGALIAATILGGIILLIGGGDSNDLPPASQIIATVVQDACFIGAAWIVAGIAGRPAAWQFGLRPPRSSREAVGLVVAGYLTFVVLSAIWLSVLGQTDTQDNLPDDLGAKDSTVAMLAVAVLVTVLAPIAEEFLFRGYFFSALRNWRGLWPAAIVTGLVFGGVHAVSSPAVFLFPLAVFGVVLCLIYARSGSLYPCIALHCINNSIAFGSSMGWDWQIPVTVLAALAAVGATLAAVYKRPD